MNTNNTKMITPTEMTAKDQVDVNTYDTSNKKSVVNAQNFILILIILSFTWYLLAERFTPYTTQARVQSYVVGVSSEVSGAITLVNVKNNQEVEPGDVLFKLDTSQYDIALSSARSSLETAKQQLNADNASVSASRSKLQAAQANYLKAEQDTTRLEKLRKEDAGTISMRRLEAARATLKQAEANVNAAKADIERVISQKGGDDDNNNAKLKSAQSAVNKAELDLKNTIIKATARGVITDLSADVGQFSHAGSPMMTLISIHDVWIDAQFTENNLGNMTIGDSVEILFDSIPGSVYKGKIRSIGIGVSAGQATQPGTLPTISNNRDWLRQAQRFPVMVSIDKTEFKDITNNIRVGGQVSVISYSDGGTILDGLGAFYIRLMSLFSYIY
jgi:multidrug resistance efflux pump